METENYYDLKPEIEALSKIRVILGTINIEAKSAAEVVSIDAALGTIIDSLAKKDDYYADQKKEVATEK